MFVQYIDGQYTNKYNCFVVHYLMKIMKDERQISSVNLNSIAQSYEQSYKKNKYLKSIEPYNICNHSALSAITCLQNDVFLKNVLLYKNGRKCRK